MVQRTVLGNEDTARNTKKTSTPPGGLTSREQLSALETTKSDSHAFQRLLERHDARAKAERARSVAAKEAAWKKSQAELTEWIHTNAPGVTRFGASVRATLPFGDTLVTGGWSTKDGKRTLALMTLEQIDAAGNRVPGGTVSGQVLVMYQFLEAPAEMLDKLGLQSLTSDAQESSISFQMPSAQAQSVIKALEGATGVDVLSAPRISTTEEVPASVASAENEIVEGQKQELGVAGSFQPIQVTPDGSSMDVGVTVRYAMRTADTLTPPSQPKPDTAGSESASDNP
jgi:hypothetical protein